MTKFVEEFPLSRAQLELWKTQQSLPNVPINTAQYVEVDGPLDIDIFVRHSSQVVKNAKFTQVRFHDLEDGPAGVYDPALHYWVEVIDLRSELHPRAIAESMMREDYSQVLDPCVDRTARGILFVLGDDKFLIYNRGHHLLSDGMGGKDKMVEALAAYTAAVRGDPPPCSNPVELDLPARVDAQYRESSRFVTDRAAWQSQMSGVGLGKSLAHRSGSPKSAGLSASAVIPATTMSRLQVAGAHHAAVIPTLIAMAFGSYLARVADGDEVILQFPVAARTTKELRSTPLPVANTVPLRTHVTPNSTVVSALKATQAALMVALRHQRYRGEDIWADVAADETSGRTSRTAIQERSGPMLNLMLFEREFPCGEATATFHILTVGPAEDLTINIYPMPKKSGPDSLMVAFDANPNRYSQAEVDLHHRRFMAMLATVSRALLEEPDRLVGELPLDAEEEAQWAAEESIDTSSPSNSTGDFGAVIVRDVRGVRLPSGLTGYICVGDRNTGDLGHIDVETGALVVDHLAIDQVVVDGVRVDLADLERAALDVEGVAAAVAVKTESGLGVGIVVEAGVDRAHVRGAIRRRVNSVVPQLIWPEYVDILDGVPMTERGVADREAVSALLVALPRKKTQYSAPEGPIEQAVANAVSDVAGAEKPSMDDELVQLGVTSMGFMQLAARLGSGLRVSVGVRDLNEVTTLRELAKVIEKAAPMRAVSGGVVRYRPTKAQREIWVVNRANPSWLVASFLAPQGSAGASGGTTPLGPEWANGAPVSARNGTGGSHSDLVYHLAVHLALAAGISEDAVRAALIDVAGRHEALRTVYHDDGGEPIAVVRPMGDAAATAPITSSTLDVAGLERAVSTLFDLTVEAPWRAVLDTSGDTVDLVLVAHHIAIDEWSLPIVLADFAIAVKARQSGNEPEWASEVTGFSATLEARDESPASGIYWTRKMRRAPERLALPAPAATAPTGLTRGPAVYLRRAISSDLRGRAVDVARSAGTTLNTLLNLAVVATLGDYTDTDDIVLSIPVAGRETSDELQTVGMFVQTVPLRITGARELAVHEALSRVAKGITEAQRHAASAPTGLADVIFAYQARQPDLAASGVIVDGKALPTYQARTALEFSVVDDETELVITLTVAEQYVDVVAAEHILDRFVDSVVGPTGADAESRVLHCAPVVALPERTGRATPLVDPIHALLQHADARPHALALVAGDERLTYRQLVARARDLSGRLQSMGVRPGDRVGLLLPEGADAVVTIVASLLADAVYVPIDPEYPQTRIDLVLDATQPAAVVRPGLEVLAGVGLGVAEPIPDGAYIIHTSGSTGVPKGVVVTRSNVAAMLGAALDVVDAGPGEVWSWVHSYAFDFSVWEIFGALASGGTVVAIDRDTVRDPQLLAERLNSNGVTILSQTPTAVAALTDPSVVDSVLPSVRTVVFGGEALSPAALRPFVSRRLRSSHLRDLGEATSVHSPHLGDLGEATSVHSPHLGDPEVAAGVGSRDLGDRGEQSVADLRLINMYGITETTVHLTACDVDLDDERSIIGAPLDGVGWVILDSRLRPVPMGGLGELYVAGDQVSMGYLNATALTATRFVADPYGSGTRMYRTGDRVREVIPGRLAYLGRDDDQVQLRGHRIELGEISTVLRSVPGVGTVRVLVAPGRTAGDERIVAFVTEDGLADWDDVKALNESVMLEACAARLPSYAVPSRVQVVEGWPMTPNGKLDRDKLLADLDESAEPSRPLTEVEETVAAAMRAVIGTDESTPMVPGTNFFAAGGTSLSAARLAAALVAERQSVGVADVFDYPTIEGLARVIVDARGEGSPGEAMPSLSEHRDEPERLPLTPEQLDLWLRWRTEPEFTGYLMNLAIPVPANPEETRRAVSAIVARHDALRTNFPVHDGSPYQRRWSDAELEAHLSRELAADIDAKVAPIDLAESLPWRLRIVERDGETWLLVVVHHIAVDGESVPILRDELTAELAGTPVVDHERVDYRQYSLWRDEMVQARRNELVEHWSAAFAEPVQPLRLPEINLRGGIDSEQAALSVHTAHGELGESVTAALDALAIERHSTAFIAAHTALAAVLAQQSGSSTVTIGTAVSGRLDARLASVPGLFARAVPLHTAIDLDVSFGELLSRVTEVDLGAFANADLPLTEIAEIADPGRGMAGNSLFEVSLGMVPGEVVEVAGLGSGGGLDTPPRLAARRLLDQRGVGLDQRGTDMPLFGIDVSMYQVEGRLHLTMSCTDAVAGAERLDALCRLVVETLERAVGNVDRPTAELLAGETSVAVPAPAVETLGDLVGTGLAERPDAMAVVGDGAMTNAELDQRSAAVARELIGHGIGPGDVVVQHLPRSVWNVVATLAVARTGAAFVNVDPRDPMERRRTIIGRARPRAVLTLAGQTVPDVDASIPVLAVNEIESGSAAPFSVSERVRPLLADDAAYVTFTSGTTGTPKGVVVTHRGIAGWARDTVARLQLTDADRVLHTYAPGFDAQLMGLVVPRIVGASIVICPPDVIAADELRDVITDHDVSVLLTTPSVLATLRPDDLPSVRHVAVGGEPLGAGLVRDWTPSVTMSNEYGPTEATVAVSSARLTHGADGAVPIGTTLAGVTAHVLDSKLRPVPVHTVGELYVAGNCLARSYLDDAALTAAAFIADPAGSGQRLYRTGDLVHRRPDGTLVIHGRTDDQVKIRGIRLEPAEIDAALSQLSEVATSVTAVRTNASGEKTLVSWVVAEPDTDLRPDALRAELSHVLPRSIVPATIISVDALPIGPNGKVDTARLPEPDMAAGAISAGAALSGATEEVIAEVWADVLEIPVAQLTADSDFFAAGGTSLSATRVTARLSGALGVEVPVRVLFEARSVRAVAERVDELRSTAPGPVPESLPIPDHLPLAHPQRGMWIHHHYDPTSTAYHVPVVIRIDGEIDVAQLRQAVDAVVDTHAVLRTAYPDSPAGPVQRIVDRDGPVLGHERVDAGAVGPAIDVFLSSPFDLEHEPGFRATVFDVSDEPSGAVVERYFVAALHHIAIDGWSMRILMHDLLRAFAGESLPSDRALTYADFTQWEMRRLGGPDDPASRYSRELGHWLTTLDGAGEPIRIPGRRDTEGAPGRITQRVDSATTHELRQTAQRLSATVFHVAHAALAAVVGQWTGRWDAVVGVPVHGRSAPEWESVVGMFVNTVALRTRVGADDPMRAVVEQARDVALTAADHAEVPYDAVARAVRPNAHDGFDPLISVLLVNEDVLPTISDEILTGGSGGEAWRAAVVDRIATVDAKFDIEVVLAEDQNGIAVTVVHSGYIPRDVAEALLGDFVTVFAAAAGDVEVPFPRLDAPAEASGRAAVTEVPVARDDASLTGQVAAVMAEVLGVSETTVGVGDDFFAIGGTSLSATRVTSTLGRELGVRVPTRLLFENPSPAELGAVVAGLRDEGVREGGVAVRDGGVALRDARSFLAGSSGTEEEPSPLPEVRGAERRATKGSDFTLSPTQRRMWTTAHLLGEVPIYAVPVVVPVPAGLGVDQVTGAVHAVVERHSALRTLFLSAADGPRQRVLGEWRPEIERMTVDEAAERLDEFAAPFDLEAAPPVRAWVLTSDSDPAAVVIVGHHIVLDGESASILGDELGALLAGGELDSAAAGFDVVARRMAIDEEHSRTEQLGFWAEALDGYSGRLDLVPDRPVARDLRTAVAEFDLGEDVSQQVAAAAHRAKASDFHVLHAGVAMALTVQSGTDDVAVATPVSMRRDAESARTVGMLVSTVVLRTRIGGGLSVGELIESVRDADLAAIDHALVAFDDVVALVDPPRETGMHPLVQVAFSVGGGLVAPQDGGVLEARSEFDLHVEALLVDGLWRLRLTYARDLFDEAGIGVLGRRMVDGVSGVVSEAGRLVAGVDLLTVGEREFVAGHAVVGEVGVDQWSRYAVSPSGSTATRPAEGGGSTATRPADGQPTPDGRVASEPLGEGAYRDHRSSRGRIRRAWSRYASSLRSSATRPAEGTSATRPAEGAEIAGLPLLGDLLAAAVARYPERVALDDGRRQLTYRQFDDWVSVTAQTLRQRGIAARDVVAVAVPRSIESVIGLWAVSRIGAVCVPVDVTYPRARLDQVIAVTGATVIEADDIPGQPTEDVAPEPVTRVSPDALAYVITTSGTTGVPNVVGVSHRGVYRVASLGDVADDDRVAMAISPGFDATFHDMLLPLAAGATLVVVPANIAGGRDLTHFLREQRVTVFTATPSVMRTLNAPEIASLRMVYIGGEALTTDLADTWARHAQVRNIYGPTETTVTVSTSTYQPGGPVRIGRPRPGIGVQVLDRYLRPVPPDVVGELYVTGTGVARGYLGDPALTAASFVAGPDGQRWYRTGDLVRWDVETAELVYLGRADRQIKIRGQRVEPAEIDAVLVGAGAHRSATVLRGGPVGPALVSYVVAAEISTDTLATACRAVLPRHMVPSRIIQVPELPLTGAGKLDEKRLPEPEWSASRRTPTTATERAVVDAFAEVLGVEIGMDDDFFAAGGNSLALLTLRDALQHRTGQTVSGPELFAHPTPAEIAALIETPDRVADDRVVRLSSRGSDQGSPVWCVHTAAGIVEQFRPLADTLTTPVLGLQLPELIDATREMPESLPELASLHVAALRAEQQSGPYRLVGWSLGGVIAHEIARQLVDAGEEVAQLVLLDPRTPAELAEVSDEELRAVHPLREAAQRRDPEAVRRFDERTAIMAQAARSYDLQPVAAGTVLYVAAADNDDPDAWGRAVGGNVEMMRVDAVHADLGEPAILRAIARVLEEES